MLPVTVAIGVVSEESEPLFVPKNQSKFGVGVSVCTSTVAEHTREKLVPAIPVLDPPEAVMVTGPMFTRDGGIEDKSRREYCTSIITIFTFAYIAKI